MVAAPWARRTLRLAQRLIALGVALGGAAGIHLYRRWDPSVSRNTLLRLLRGCRFRLALRLRCWAWMTLRCANAKAMAPC
jgi:hypothetical protein